MARMRLRVRSPREALHAREINNNVLHPAEVPVRNKVGAPACAAAGRLCAVCLAGRSGRGRRRALLQRLSGPHSRLPGQRAA